MSILWIIKNILPYNLFVLVIFIVVSQIFYMYLVVINLFWGWRAIWLIKPLNCYSEYRIQIQTNQWLIKLYVERCIFSHTFWGSTWGNIHLVAVKSPEKACNISKMELHGFQLNSISLNFYDDLTTAISDKTIKPCLDRQKTRIRAMG